VQVHVNQMLNRCSNDCERTCEDQINNAPEKLCLTVCLEKCTCFPGNLMDSEGNCVPKSSCEPKRNYFFPENFQF